MTKRKDPPRPTGQTMLTLACIHCGKEFVRRLGRQTHMVRGGHRGPYCSKSCSTSAANQLRPPRPFDAIGFWRRVERPGPDQCWPWQGARQSSGYGNLVLERGWRRTHRVAYKLTKGPIPAGMVVMHICDNPPCCNPTHLQVGTTGDNNRDRVAKGRYVGKTPTAMAEKLGEAMG